MKGIARILLMPVLLGLVACAPGPGSWPDQYRLQSPSPPPSAKNTKRTRSGGILRVAPVTGPFATNRQTIDYTLSYASPNQVSAYSKARWTAPPERMIGSALRSCLAESGRWKAVIGPENQSEADWTLEFDLDKLLQVFPRPDNSFALLQGQADLRHTATNRLVAQREFSYRIPAPGADVQAGVSAFNRAITKLCGDLGDWLGPLTARRKDAGGGEQDMD
ncbi:MAG TPA: ABC-type transport auxiliary lipoprotein family protein [Gammaproteobacteria bacterium]|nr:ABC-type transport auxiliary lipoprotein family protein [Gammaproteobacteria bacterium]